MTRQTFLVLPVGKYYKIAGEFDSIYKLQGNSPHRDWFRVYPKTLNLNPKPTNRDFHYMWL
jgi:hypothetical protein